MSIMDIRYVTTALGMIIAMGVIMTIGIGLVMIIIMGGVTFIGMVVVLIICIVVGMSFLGVDNMTTSLR